MFASPCNQAADEANSEIFAVQLVDSRVQRRKKFASAHDIRRGLLNDYPTQRFLR